jgi:hypothetical protein
LYPRTFGWEITAVALSLLGYFLSMIAALTAVVGVMIGLFDTSTSERMGRYSHPRVVERNVTATNSEPRLFMVVPKTKDGSPAKNIVEVDSAAVEANSPAVSPERADAEKSKPHKLKVLARQRQKYEGGHNYAMSAGQGSGYRPGLDGFH